MAGKSGDEWQYTWNANDGFCMDDEREVDDV